MKTTKMISAALLIAMLSTIGLSSVSAYGQWNGEGSGNTLTEEQRAEVQNMTQEEREAYMEENWREMQDDDNDGIPNKDDEDYERSEDGENRLENAWTWNQSENASDMAREEANQNSALLKARYKNTYKTKYGKAIERMDNEQVDTFIGKINAISEKVEAWDYSYETKEKFNAMLGALKELAEESIED